MNAEANMTSIADASAGAGLTVQRSDTARAWSIPRRVFLP